MADPFKHVIPGEPVRFGARAWNSMLDAGRAMKDSTFNQGRGPQDRFRQADIIKIQNETGSDLDRRSVVGLDGPIITPSDNTDTFLEQVTFSAVTPTVANDTGRFAILLDPIPVLSVGRAWISGVCQVQVNLISLLHKTADVTDTDVTQLTSSDNGSAQILWCEADEGGSITTGTQWAIVRFGTGAPGIAFAKSTGTITAGAVGGYGSGPATVQKIVAGAFTDDTGNNITVYNLTNKTIASGAILMIAYSWGKWWATVPDSCGHLS